jgi:hypothetical protein
MPTHSPESLATSRQFDRLELTATAYLALPLLIFFVGWWEWPVALGLLALLTLTATVVLRKSALSAPSGLSLKRWGLILLCSSLWLLASGLVGSLPLDADWQIRMIVLRDLVVGNWPVGYGPGDTALGGGDRVLRFSTGYYLVPAAIGKVIGFPGARIALAVWTWLGVLLLMALALDDRAEPSRRRWPATLVVIAVLMLFSGMDIMGWLTRPHPWPSPGQHIEWWESLFQYSSNTTLLFWAPNHAMPGWLAAVVAWRHRQSGLAAAPIALLLVASCLWSPLACVGIAPLLLACNLRGQSLWLSLREFLRGPVLAIIPGVLLIGCFVTFGVPQVAVDTASQPTRLLMEMPLHLLRRIAVFSFWEWGLLVMLLALARRLPWLGWFAAAELICLPWVQFGPANDLVMRGGIAPMMILTLTTARALSLAGTAAKWRIALLAVLLVGVITPWQELQRRSLPGSRWPEASQRLVEQQGPLWHYIGILRPGWLKNLMRQPVTLEKLP